MIGLFYLVDGLSSIVAAAVLLPFAIGRPHLLDQSVVSCEFWYYIIFLVIAVVTCAVYIAVSKWYKNRERGDLEESEPYYRRVSLLY